MVRVLLKQIEKLIFRRTRVADIPEIKIVPDQKSEDFSIEDIYTPLEEAKAELLRRRNDKGLEGGGNNLCNNE